jgi:hypothetical protein
VSSLAGIPIGRRLRRNSVASTAESRTSGRRRYQLQASGFGNASSRSTSGCNSTPPGNGTTLSSTRSHPEMKLRSAITTGRSSPDARSWPWPVRSRDPDPDPYCPKRRRRGKRHPLLSQHPTDSVTRVRGRRGMRSPAEDKALTRISLVWRACPSDGSRATRPGHGVHLAAISTGAVCRAGPVDVGGQRAVRTWGRPVGLVPGGRGGAAGRRRREACLDGLPRPVDPETQIDSTPTDVMVMNSHVGGFDSDGGTRNDCNISGTMRSRRYSASIHRRGLQSRNA